MKTIEDFWINVEDALPETEDNVLAVLYGEVCVMAYFNLKENGETHKVWGMCYDGLQDDAFYDGEYAPTKWMPIPKP